MVKNKKKGNTGNTMKPSYLDTLKMTEIGNNIIALANDYELEITKLFKRLNDMPYITKEWMGNQAEKYVSIVALDKDDFINFGENIKSYGKKILTDAESFDHVIERNIREERNKEII